MEDGGSAAASIDSLREDVEAALAEAALAQVRNSEDTQWDSQPD